MRLLLAFLLALAVATPAAARETLQTPVTLPAGQRAEIDRIAAEVLAATSVPSASIAIVKNGAIAYAQAYGEARPGVRATPETRYAIGSISKQFTAAALLLLAEEGRLTLDATLQPLVPGLTRGGEITVRQILSHTAGYRDYWPQDFVPGLMTRPINAQGIMTRWARIPLDYAPGAEYRYSNTGFTIAGVIAERLSGQSLHAFQQARLFAPLGMTGVTEIDSGPLTGPLDSVGHARWGLGPVRPAVKEGPGWLWAIGELAMRPTDLALWNVNLMKGGPVLSAASKAAMTTSVTLTGGATANYGLGLDVRARDGKRVWSHGGAVSGYLADNRVFPDEDLAITVLTNGEFGGAHEALAARLRFLLREQPPKVEAARTMLAAFQAGRIDRTRLTPNGAAYYTDAAVRELARTLRPLGAARLVTLDADRLRGGLTVELYTVTFAARRATIIARADPATGRYEQFVVDFGA
ncbi:MAG: serine hydrolase domain-containing protein [Hyphomonadaceae bacterium]|nr:serine hydrolase domain-containing protein [Hyphomonadaceae bacterium]